MHCQKATVRAIVDSGHDYCIGVKGNQKKLLEKIKKQVEDRTPCDIYVKPEKNRNRYEVRGVRVFGAFYGARNDWAGIRSIIEVQRVRRLPSKD